MRRRTKRRLAVAGIIVVGVVAGVLLWPKDTRPKVTAFGSRWVVEDLQWTPLFDHYALSFNLSLDSGAGAVEATPPRLDAFCETVLSKPPQPPSSETDRADIYRVSFNVRNHQRRVFDDDVDIAVVDGECQPRDLTGRFTHLYPAPMTHWTVREDLDVSLSASDDPEYSFKWDGPGVADLERFPFEAACTAIVMDPPDGLAPASGKRPNTVTIWAEKEVGAPGSGQFTAATRTYRVVEGGCVEEKGS